jgi:hypothetical protein
MRDPAYFPLLPLDEGFFLHVGKAPSAFCDVRPPDQKTLEPLEGFVFVEGDRVQFCYRDGVTRCDAVTMGAGPFEATEKALVQLLRIFGRKHGEEPRVPNMAVLQRWCEAFRDQQLHEKYEDLDVATACDPRPLRLWRVEVKLQAREGFDRQAGSAWGGWAQIHALSRAKTVRVDFVVSAVSAASAVSTIRGHHNSCRHGDPQDEISNAKVFLLPEGDETWERTKDMVEYVRGLDGQLIAVAEPETLETLGALDPVLGVEKIAAVKVHDERY